MWPFKKKAINPNWYFIDGKWVHYIRTMKGTYLDGRELSLREQCEFENKNFSLVVKGK